MRFKVSYINDFIVRFFTFLLDNDNKHNSLSFYFYFYF